MIKELKMYLAECDQCKVHYEVYDGVGAIPIKDVLSKHLRGDNDWAVTKDGKTYCQDCFKRVGNKETGKIEVFSKDGTKLLGIEE